MLPSVLTKDTVNIQSLPSRSPCRTILAGRTGFGLAAGALYVPVTSV